MKRINIITVISATLFVALFAVVNFLNHSNETGDKKIKVGFVYIGDASNPYTNNFIRSQKELEAQYGDRIEIHLKENVAEGTEDASLRQLIKDGCDIIFTTSYGYQETTKQLAAEYPDVQFCQATAANANEDPVYDNYHTFMGHIYQGRYVAGVVAGMKLQELIETGELEPEDAVIGYVAAFPYAETISGYTAFLLGVRSVVPDAMMKVRYVYSWGNYKLEKETAETLIEEGCVLISQHSDTIGPAVACEKTSGTRMVYHVGYNQSAIEIAPTTSLISARINWTPYILSAVDAVYNDKEIEDCVEGTVNGNDVGAGFSDDWVEMLQLNSTIAAKGTQEKMEEVIKALKNGKINVFQGDYIGVDPQDSSDTYDLRDGYMENATSSAPTFHYVLQDIIQIEED